MNAASTKVYDGNTAVISATDFVATTTSPLATSDAMSTITTAQVTNDLGRSTSNGLVTNAVVVGGIGGPGFVTADNITNTAITETTLAHALNNEASSLLSGVQVDVPFGVGTINVLAAEAITSTATAVSDGTLPTAAATNSINFLNLTVAGVPIVITPGEIITVTDGLSTDVARVTIMPVSTISQTATSSSAESVALLIDVLAGDLAGTRVQLGRSYAESNVANNTPTGPTMISLTSISFNAQATSLWSIISLAVLGLITAVAAYRYRQRPSRRPLVKSS